MSAIGQAVFSVKYIVFSVIYSIIPPSPRRPVLQMSNTESWRGKVTFPGLHSWLCVTDLPQPAVRPGASYRVSLSLHKNGGLCVWNSSCILSNKCEPGKFLLLPGLATTCLCSVTQTNTALFTHHPFTEDPNRKAVMNKR